jgi:hypothetical protein
MILIFIVKIQKLDDNYISGYFFIKLFILLILIELRG